MGAISIMKIVIDRNIPFITAPLASLGEVVALPGLEISHDVMADADILLTRTRTRCDAALLDGSRCRFIGTATIGTDHIDLGYCSSHGITVANAPGCNAPAVAQWVLAAAKAHAKAKGTQLTRLSLGVIGAGNVGSILIRWASGLGMRVLVNDPPLMELHPEAYSFSSIADIARECDIISVHTPLTHNGPHPTYHLIDAPFISLLQRKPLILNAARGPVTDTAALTDALRSGTVCAVGIDCWEEEPDIDHTLLEMAAFATPHIAGYSRQGKIRASQMILDALSLHFHLARPLKAVAPDVPPTPVTVTSGMLTYDILADTAQLKARPDLFESLRNNYPLREEPCNM